MDGAVSLLEQVSDDLAKLAGGFDADLLSGKQAQRVVCAAADIERFAVTLKTAMRRVDESGAWRSDGSRSAVRWLAAKTGTSMAEACGTVELGEQLESLPAVSDAARRGVLSPAQTRMVAQAASKDPASASQLVGVARRESFSALRKECAAAAAARRRGRGPGAVRGTTRRGLRMQRRRVRQHPQPRDRPPRRRLGSRPPHRQRQRRLEMPPLPQPQNPQTLHRRPPTPQRHTHPHPTRPATTPPPMTGAARLPSVDMHAVGRFEVASLVFAYSQAS